MKTTQILRVVSVMAIGFLSTNQSYAQDKPSQVTLPRVAAPTVVDPAALKRWQDDRFGMFIHWGPISEIAQEISWSRGKEVPIEKYDNLSKTFNPEKFNADEWVGVAKAAGMKYIVLVCKHHDGFCLWPTKQTDYNIANTPFKRDIVGELAASCKKQGIAFGCYYSACDWHNPDFPLTSWGGKVVRDHSDLEKYTAYLKAQVTELLTNYGPLITLWFDVPQKFDKQRGQGVIDMARSIQPDILINNRTGAPGDYLTPEQQLGGFNRQQPWESCITISAHGHWSWGGDKDGVKSLKTLIETLAGSAGGDGNMLLNVGPQPDGQINAAQVGRLKEMGQWMDKYGDTIYGTRGGPYKPGTWGAATCKGNEIYLHIFKWEGDALHLPPLGKKIVKSELLTGGNVSVTQDDHGVAVAVAPSDHQEIDTIVKLELDGPAFDIPIGIAASGSIATGKPATASSVSTKNPKNTPDKAFDDDATTIWAAEAGTTSGWLEVDLGQTMTITHAQIIAANTKLAQASIQSYELQYQDQGQWKTFFTGKTLGASPETFKFPPITAQHVRLNILESTEAPTISEFELFSAP